MKIREFFKKYIFPPKCAFCRRVLEKDGVCNWCKANLPYSNPSEIKELPMFIDGAYSCFNYEGDVKNAILRYKFGGLSKYSVDFSEFLEKCLNENLSGKYDIISWIPLSRKRLRKRGYDQARLLSEEVCVRLGETPVRTLVKNIDSSPQSRQKEVAKRVANVLGAYEIASVDVTDKSIVLFDDVFTTGSTASECARVLKTAGAAHVYVVTLAKTKKRKK